MKKNWHILLAFLLHIVFFAYGLYPPVNNAVVLHHQVGNDYMEFGLHRESMEHVRIVRVCFNPSHYFTHVNQIYDEQWSQVTPFDKKFLISCKRYVAGKETFAWKETNLMNIFLTGRSLRLNQNGDKFIDVIGDALFQFLVKNGSYDQLMLYFLNLGMAASAFGKDIDNTASALTSEPVDCMIFDY